LRGKPLYPTLTYRNMSVQVNLGVAPLVPLPFKCRMVAEAALADVEVAKETAAPADGKYEVVFPVGLPGQGYFDVVDQFLEKNPNFHELSDRKIFEWAEKSGLSRPKSAGGSNDKPESRFDIQAMDDMSVKKLLNHVAPTARRNFIVPELKANLLPAERAKLLQRFAVGFKRISVVAIGEPTAEYKAKVQEAILAEKKVGEQRNQNRKADEEKRKKGVEQKRKINDLRRQIAQAKRKKEDTAALEEDMLAAEEPLPEAEPMEVDVELTEEEKALTHRKTPLPDIPDGALSRVYSNFALPSKDEGFDEIMYEWQSGEAATQVLKDWIFAKKLAQREDNIKPGEGFKEKSEAWTKNLQEYRKRLTQWKDVPQRKKLLEKRAGEKKKAAKEAEEKGEEPPKEDPEDLKVEDLDVFTVEDVMDVGTGEPLFANFQFEDWTLLATRVELHMLMHAFKKDINDPDRTKIPEKDLAFYYNKYFRKNFAYANFQCKQMSELADLIKDVVKFSEGATCLESVLEEEDASFVTFVKLTEEHRRERQRRVDAGDETADLKFPRGPQQPQSRPAANGGGRGEGGRPAPSGARPAPWTAQAPRGSAGAAPGAQKRPYGSSPGPSTYVAKRPRQDYGRR